MATEKQVAASRANGSLSKGPITQEGKDVSRCNSLSTGLYSMGFILPEHLETEILETRDWIHSKVSPDNEIENVLEAGLATNLVLFREGVRLQIAHKLKVAQRTIVSWDEDRKLAAARVGEDLGKRPVAVALELSNSKHGCEFLLEIWQQLGAVLENSGDWTDGQKSLAQDLLGVHPVVRGAGDVLSVPHGVAAKTHLHGVFQTEVARLAERRDGALHDLDETERQHALLGNLPNDSTLENYVRGTNRNLNKVMSIVKTLQLAMGRVGTAAALDMPRRTKGELKIDFNSRMYAFHEKQRKLDDAGRAEAHAKRLAANAAAERAEREAQPQYQPGTAMEAYIAKLKRWHKRIHGAPPAPPAPPCEPEISLRTKMVDALPEAIAEPRPETSPGPLAALDSPAPAPAPPTAPRRDRRNE